MYCFTCPFSYFLIDNEDSMCVFKDEEMGENNTLPLIASKDFIDSILVKLINLGIIWVFSNK